MHISTRCCALRHAWLNQARISGSNKRACCSGEGQGERVETASSQPSCCSQVLREAARQKGCEVVPLSVDVTGGSISLAPGLGALQQARMQFPGELSRYTVWTVADAAVQHLTCKACTLCVAGCQRSCIKECFASMM